MSVARAILAAAGLLCWALGATARGQETLDEIEARLPASPPGPSEQRPRERAATVEATAEVNGYLADRVGYGWVSPAGPISTQDMPSLSEMAEANIQLRVDLGDKTRFVYADLSLVYQGGWLFYVDDKAGGRQAIADHDIPSLHPFVAPSELYLSISPRPSLNVLVGKKRITWGSGFAFNPTDVINPPKDPTDPNFQRAGNWVARVEAPFEKFTVTGLIAPQALYTQSGIPYAFLRYRFREQIADRSQLLAVLLHRPRASRRGAPLARKRAQLPGSRVRDRGLLVRRHHRIRPHEARREGLLPSGRRRLAPSIPGR